MYINVLLILFFTSLLAIMYMITRKLILLKNGKIQIEEKIAFGVPHIEKVKHLTIRNFKKYEHASLVVIVQLYLKSRNFLKNKSEEIKIKLKNWNTKNHINSEKKEISKFLKIIGDYKRKIREIEHKIKKGEKL